jgi:ubiquinone/menaquinone biosynthesis C-methylase UbiE
MLEAMNDEQENNLSQRAFDRHVSGYEATLVDWHSSTMKDAALRHIYRPVRGDILDVGCGPGILLATLAGENPALRLAGIDPDPETIRVAKERLGARADLRLGDAGELPWEDGQFDLVTCVNSFHRYPHPRHALAEMHRVLKLGGVLVIADPCAPPIVRQLMNLLRVLQRRGNEIIYGQREMMWMLGKEGFEQITWSKEGSFGFVATAMVPNVVPGMAELETMV